MASQGILYNTHDWGEMTSTRNSEAIVVWFSPMGAWRTAESSGTGKIMMQT